MRQSIDLNMEELGAEFANCGDGDQAKFFHGLAFELRSWPTHFQRESQGCAVSLKLSKEDRDTLRVFLDGVTSKGDKE